MKKAFFILALLAIIGLSFAFAGTSTGGGGSGSGGSGAWNGSLWVTNAGSTGNFARVWIANTMDSGSWNLYAGGTPMLNWNLGLLYNPSVLGETNLNWAKRQLVGQWTNTGAFAVLGSMTVGGGTLSGNNGIFTQINSSRSAPYRTYLMSDTNANPVWVNRAMWKELSDFSTRTGFQDTNDFDSFSMVTNAAAIGGATNYWTTNGVWMSYYGCVTNVGATGDWIKNSLGDGNLPVSFMTASAATNFDILIRGNNGPVNVMIQDKYKDFTRANLPFYVDGSGGSGLTRCRVALPGVGIPRFRNFYISTEGGNGIAGIQCDTNDVFIPPSIAPVATWVMSGDSGIIGRGCTNMAYGFAQNLIKATRGQINVICNGRNSTGYAHGSPNTFGAAMTNTLRQAKNVMGIDVTAVIFAGGSADINSNSFNIFTCATNAFQMVKNENPDDAAEIYMMLPWDLTPSKSYDQVTTNLARACSVMTPQIPTFQILIPGRAQSRFILQSGTYIGHPTDLAATAAATESLYLMYSQSNMFSSFKR